MRFADRSLVHLFLLLSLATPALGQTPPPAGESQRFFAFDIFGGAHPQESAMSGVDRREATFGWEIGSTVRVARWVGVAVNAGRVRTPERTWITHAQVGPRVSSPIGGINDVRGVAHVLLGRATSERLSGDTGASAELMAGGGVGLFSVFRLQLDVVRRHLEGLPRTESRFLFGVALPLCVRGCTTADGFELSRH
ncbi:MAG: hypothetical protein AB7N65_10550 [Vicinamibacterales bacterium]